MCKTGRDMPQWSGSCNCSDRWFWLRGGWILLHATLFLFIKTIKTMFHFHFTARLCDPLCWYITWNPNKLWETNRLTLQNVEKFKGYEYFCKALYPNEQQYVSFIPLKHEPHPKLNHTLTKYTTPITGNTTHTYLCSSHTFPKPRCTYVSMCIQFLCQGCVCLFFFTGVDSVKQTLVC